MGPAEDLNRYHPDWISRLSIALLSAAPRRERRAIIVSSPMLRLVFSSLVFSGFTDGSFIAYDDTTLEQLWKINVGVGFNAPPMSFEVNGKQYVAILAGLSRIAIGKHAFTPELKEQRNQPMLFVFGL